jgi:hypothetical protein
MVRDVVPSFSLQMILSPLSVPASAKAAMAQGVLFFYTNYGSAEARHVSPRQWPTKDASHSQGAVLITAPPHELRCSAAIDLRSGGSSGLGGRVQVYTAPFFLL